MRLPNLLRSTPRQIRKDLGFFLVAIATLALGIGANTAIFSAVEALLLRSLPYGDPSHLVIVWEDASSIGFSHNTPAPANFVDWRAQNLWLANCYGRADFTGAAQVDWLSLSERIRWQ